MSKRRYYSSRKHGTQIDLGTLKELFYSLFGKLAEGSYFDESMGFSCVDSGYVPGTMGTDISEFFFLRLRRRDLYPFENREAWTEDDLFDVIELLHDNVSKPVDGYHHDYANCGWHYSTFDGEAGRAQFRESVNDILADYGGGYEIRPNGEIFALGEPHLRSLLTFPVPSYDVEHVDGRVDAAVTKFLRQRSSLEDRRDAVKNLVEVLEFLRERLKTVMLKDDDAALFGIANNFGIRHNKRQQKTQYDRRIWLTWMFYVYLATIHATVRLIRKQDEEKA